MGNKKNSHKTKGKAGEKEKTPEGSGVNQTLDPTTTSASVDNSTREEQGNDNGENTANLPALGRFRPPPPNPPSTRVLRPSTISKSEISKAHQERRGESEDYDSDDETMEEDIIPQQQQQQVERSSSPPLPPLAKNTPPTSSDLSSLSHTPTISHLSFPSTPENSKLHHPARERDDDDDDIMGEPSPTPSPSPSPSSSPGQRGPGPGPCPPPQIANLLKKANSRLMTKEDDNNNNNKINTLQEGEEYKAIGTAIDRLVTIIDNLQKENERLSKSAVSREEAWVRAIDSMERENVELRDEVHKLITWNFDLRRAVEEKFQEGFEGVLEIFRKRMYKKEEEEEEDEDEKVLVLDGIAQIFQKLKKSLEGLGADGFGGGRDLP